MKNRALLPGVAFWIISFPFLAIAQLQEQIVQLQARVAALEGENAHLSAQLAAARKHSWSQDVVEPKGVVGALGEAGGFVLKYFREGRNKPAAWWKVQIDVQSSRFDREVQFDICHVPGGAGQSKAKPKIAFSSMATVYHNSILGETC